MRVNPNSEPSVVAGNVGANTPAAPRLGQDRSAFATSETLSRSLEQTPEIRADKVAEAKALIQDGTYPPAVIIRKISALLANNLDKSV